MTLETTLEAIGYPFAYTQEEVNWDARARINTDYMARNVLPDLIDFTADAVKKTTFSDHALKSVVPVSGGLDSCISACLVAETMLHNPNAGNSLVLVGFNGTNEEDAKYSAQFFRWFKDYATEKGIEKAVQVVSYDIRGLLHCADVNAEEMVHASGRSKVYEGELSTRFLSNLVREFSDRIGHCYVDSTNGSEIIIGELVLGAGGDYSPLVDLYKSQLWTLAEMLAVPLFIRDRPPINSTFGSNKMTTYFRKLPDGMMPQEAYAVLDPVLYGLYDLHRSPRTVARELGHSRSFVERVSKRIEDQKLRRNPPFFAMETRSVRYARNERSDENRKITREDMYESASKR